MIPGTSIEDFIAANTARLADKLGINKPAIDPQAVANSVAQAQNSSSTPTPTAVTPASPTQTLPNDQTQTLSPVEPVTHTPATPPQTPPSTTDIPDLDASSTEDQEDQKSSTAVNFKNIRKALNESKSKLNEKDSELNSTKEELERYKTGEVVPDVVAQLEEKIQKLSKYEKIVNLKASEEYQTRVVTPITQLKQKVINAAKEYNIPENIINRALTFETERELNQFLSNNFDAVGALEVKNTINSIKKIETEAKAMEAEPESALQSLIAEGVQAREDRIRSNKKAIAVTARSAWIRSATKIRNDGSIPELVIRDDDSAHNENVSKPILTAAATEYGKFVNMLADNGLETLTEEMSDFVANMVLKGMAAHVLEAQRTNAVSAYDRLAKNTERDNNYFYPPVGSSPGVASGNSRSQAIPDAKTMALDHINSILAKKQK